MHCRADAPRSNPFRAILNFFSLKNSKRLRLLWTEISRDREISCKKNEMSCESHWEENVRLADGNKWRPRKNYRPVSLTSLTSKVMEHIVYCQISRHLSINRISSPHQHGFQRGLSCETQLITVIYEWASVLNVHCQVDVVFLDFAKAFDSVPHERLLLKADYYGIHNKTNIWLRSF